MRDAADFLAKAKANPKSINTATTISGFSYYTLCKAQKAGGFEVNAVDVGSASAMVPAVLGDQVETALNSYGVFKQYIESGEMIPLFTLGTKRNPSFDTIPTAAEVGIENAECARAYFIAFPKGTDEAILKQVSDAMANIQNNSEYVEAIKSAYCVEPYFVPYNEANGVLDGILSDMEQYKDALNSGK